MKGRKEERGKAKSEFQDLILVSYLTGRDYVLGPSSDNPQKMYISRKLDWE